MHLFAYFQKVHKNYGGQVWLSCKQVTHDELSVVYAMPSCGLIMTYMPTMQKMDRVDNANEVCTGTGPT